MNLLSDRRFISLLIVTAAGGTGLLIPKNHGGKSANATNTNSPGHGVGSLPFPVQSHPTRWQTKMSHNPFESPAVVEITPIMEIAPTPSAPIPDLRVTAVLLGDTPRAIINGRAVRIGDDIGAARVVAIGPDEVLFRVNNSMVTVPTGRADMNGAERDR